MNHIKSRLPIITLTLVLCLLSACAPYTEGKKKLDEYCPGLTINLKGVTWTKSEVKKVFELTYDDDSHQATEAYFTKTGNGYSEGKPDDFSNIKINNSPVVNKNDHFLVKTIQKSMRTVTVIFIEAKQQIIIIDYFYVKK